MVEQTSGSGYLYVVHGEPSRTKARESWAEFDKVEETLKKMARSRH